MCARIFPVQEKLLPLSRFVSHFQTVKNTVLRQEMMERVLVSQLRKRIAKGGSLRHLFLQATALAEKMPKDRARDTTTQALQQYSTPLDMAFAVQAAIRAWERGPVLEPAAGNGALLTTVASDNAVAYELDPSRATSLEKYDIRVRRKSSLEPENYTDQTFGAVIANPPFGSQKDAAGQARAWPVQVAGRPASLKKREYAMSALALRRLDPQTGRAALILGSLSPAEQSKADADRGQRYAKSGDSLTFFNWLHENYKVTGHYTALGNLYSPQGAAWPVDIVLIDQAAEDAAVVPKPWERAPEQLCETDDLLLLFDAEASFGADAAAAICLAQEAKEKKLQAMKQAIARQPRVCLQEKSDDAPRGRTSMRREPISNNMKRGGIWIVSGGSDYVRSPRPAVILQNDIYQDSELITICMLTTDVSEHSDIRPMIRPDSSNGLSDLSRLMVDKIITVPRTNMEDKIGVLGETDMLELGRAVIHFWGLDDSPDHR